MVIELLVAVGAKLLTSWWVEVGGAPPKVFYHFPVALLSINTSMINSSMMLELS